VNSDRDELRNIVFAAVLGEGFRRATFAGTKRGPARSPWVRVSIRPVEIKSRRLLQFTTFDGRKTDVQNYDNDEARKPLEHLLEISFAGIHIDTDSESMDLRTTKKGVISIGRTKGPSTVAVETEHNRVKDLPLPEGRADHLLEVLGIATVDGHVKPTMRAKFTQVNEFLKQLAHAIREAELNQLGRPIEILDCGCGSSYLTFAAHHYLNNVLHIPANLLGVDVNDDLIRASTAKASHLAAEGVSFTGGTIGKLKTKPDIVLALHACDTATDDAIAQAIASEATVFLGVPCCHRHLNRQLGKTGVLAPALRHGILRERQADLLTDAFRALSLRIAGYKTDVVEFVSPEHTAKNLMIRALRGGPINDPALIAEYEAMKSFWGVEPYGRFR
jgi:hypothetical protein